MVIHSLISPLLTGWHEASCRQPASSSLSLALSRNLASQTAIRNDISTMQQQWPEEKEEGGRKGEREANYDGVGAGRGRREGGRQAGG